MYGIVSAARRTSFPALILGIAVLTLLVYFYLASSRPAPFPSFSSTALPIQDHVRPGAPYRDSHPISTAQHFLALAEAEVSALKLDTCNGLLRTNLVKAYESSRLDYCNSTSPDGAHIACFPVKDSAFSRWWPYANAFCTSSGLSPGGGNSKEFVGKCEITEAGAKLRADMAMWREEFLGTSLTPLPNLVVDESKIINRTILLVHRQDQWSPYHVAEDLVTSILALLLAGASFPHLAEERIQLVFNDDFALERNHFTEVWDRMGAWPPRRLSLDPFEPGIHLTNVIHSIGAGSSLLSSVGVGNEWNCASTLVWAASHYYRHLFGLQPLSSAISPRSPINILWLSRAKFNANTPNLSDWQKERLLSNEPELIARFVAGLTDLCSRSYSRYCEFQDSIDFESWSSSPKSRRRQIRFVSMDPSVHALPSQIHLVAHSTIVVGLHGGALGLSFFLPPGSGAAVLELHTSITEANYHFHNMAKQMGLRYEMLVVSQTVNVEETWNGLKDLVLEQLG